MLRYEDYVLVKCYGIVIVVRLVVGVAGATPSECILSELALLE